MKDLVKTVCMIMSLYWKPNNFLRSIFAKKYLVGWKRHVAQTVKVLKGLVSRGNR